MATTRISNKSDFSSANIIYQSPSVTIETVLREVEIEWKLPFGVRFENIGITGYNRDNVPPIGIAVVGLNNYII